MADAHHDHGGHGAGPTFGGHGQLMVGEGPIYLSHLPMFMFDPRRHEHNFQVILEVAIQDDGTDPQGGYVADAREHRGTFYTLRPDEFHMIDLVAPEGGRPPLRSFPGLIVRGHFERGGLALPNLQPASPRMPPANVTVHVTRVVYFQAFQPDAAPLAGIEYVLFGSGSQVFAAHVITRPPDFDQMLAVRFDGEGPTDEDLRQGVRIAIPDRRNAIGDRLGPGERVEVEARPPATDSFHIEALAEIYLEQGELGHPASFEPTPEEIAAGMP